MRKQEGEAQTTKEKTLLLPKKTLKRNEQKKEKPKKRRILPFGYKREMK